ncbi:MAG: hypothetical protein K8H74_15260 [Notoacmeibacter sp.]|nr:hypothetical protein [Notoacmeibacter sp.]
MLCGGLSFLADTDFAIAKSAACRIATLNDGVWQESMRVRGGGNVGIGTATPSTKLHVDGPVRVKTYTAAGLPSASANGAGSIAFVSDESGGAVLDFSDGANWRRVTDRAVVA